MRVYGWVFLAVGAVFIAAPVPLNRLLDAVAARLPGSTPLPNAGTGLWLGLSGSLMAVIALLSFQIARDPHRSCGWTALLLSKAVSASLFTAFSAASRNTAFLLAATVDSAIFVHLALLRSAASRPYRSRADGEALNEAWFVMVRDPDSKRGFWARYARSRGRAQCRAVLFDKAAGLVSAEQWERLESDVESGADTAYRLGPCALARGRAVGAAWELSWPEPEIGAWSFAPPLLAGAGLLSAGYEAAEALVRVSGEAAVGAERVRFVRAPGGVGHLWSRRGARGWRWTRAVFERPEGTTVFELLSADAPLVGRASVPLTAARLAHGGRSFKSVGTAAALLARSELRAGVWSFRVRMDGVVAEGSCRLDEELTADFPYDGPGGGGLCRTSMTGDMSLTLRESGRVLAELESSQDAIVEIAAPRT